MTGLPNNHQGAELGAEVPADAGKAAPAVTVKPRYSRAGVGRKAGVRSSERVEKTRSLINELMARAMSTADICDFLKFSASGARKYLADLRAAGLLVLRRDLMAPNEPPMFGLIANLSLVSEFLDSMGQARASGSKPTNLDRALSDTSRHIHIMADDAFYSVRVSRVTIAPDPRALPAEFFRPPPALRAAIRPRGSPVVLVKTIAFPVPDRTKFVLEVA